ncbi:hypothetical protein DX926_09405 [Bacillus atrophaeus]|nr:hypothetical protein DX926_09405 [Bacillus atrophaeus]
MELFTRGLRKSTMALLYYMRIRREKRGYGVLLHITKEYYKHKYKSLRLLKGEKMIFMNRLNA